MDGEPEEVEGGKKRRVTAQLDRLRKMAGVDLKAKVLSHTNFPEGAGIASSAAGFSALTLAASQALGLSFDKKQLSIQTRLAGSGSACRSVFGGYVRWRSGDTSETSYAEQIAPPGHWSLRDIVAVVSEKEKKVSSLAGHQLAPTSPYYKGRLEQMEERNEQVQTAIMSRDLKLLGLILERDAIDLHLIAMSSNPPIYYWEPSTVLIMNEIRSWREEGLDAYFTLDAGSTVHTICQESDEQEVISRLQTIKGVRFVLSNRPGPGVSLSDNHLF